MEDRMMPRWLLILLTVAVLLLAFYWLEQEQKMQEFDTYLEHREDSLSRYYGFR